MSLDVLIAVQLPPQRRVTEDKLESETNKIALLRNITNLPRAILIGWHCTHEHSREYKKKKRKKKKMYSYGARALKGAVEVGGKASYSLQ